MRTLSAGMLASIAKSITDPVFLFKIDFESQFIYATSRESITYDTNTYLTLGAKVLSIDGSRVRFTLPNFDRTISALSLAGQIQGNDIDIYIHYDGETKGRFVGLIDTVEMSGDHNTVTIVCVSEFAMGAKWPTDRLRPPLANHLPPPGFEIEFGTGTLTLERDRN